MSKKIKNLIVFICLLVAVFAAAHFALAEINVGLDAANIPAETGLGDSDPRIIAARIIRIALGFLGIIAVGLIIYAGWLWMTAGGEADRIEKAKKILIGAVIGLLIVLSAFAIASFILSKLIEATGGQGGDGGGGDDDGRRPRYGATNVRATSPRHGATYQPRNTQPLFIFTNEIEVRSGPGSYNDKNKSVAGDGFKFIAVNSAQAESGGASALDNNFKLERTHDINRQDDSENLLVNSDGTPAPQLIEGIRSIPAEGGRKVYKFKASAGCGDTAGTPNCLASWSKFKATINGQSGIFALGGRQYVCEVGRICEFVFSTGEAIDRTDPTSGIVPAQMCVDDGTLTSDANTVIGWGRDEKMSYLTFSQLLIPPGDQPPSPEIWGDPVRAGQELSYLQAANKYNTRDMAAGDQYRFSVYAYDLADHSSISSFTTTIKPGHCCNGEQDAGETGIDCGGECLACFGGPCNKEEPNQCALSGQPSNSNCDDNLCSTFVCECQDPSGFGCRCGSKPMIFNISPLGEFCSNDNNKFCQTDAECVFTDARGSGICNTDRPNGARGNLVTISGRYFGNAPGENGGVYFTPFSNEKARLANAVNDKCISSWTDTQIIAEVPGDAAAGAAEGPVKVVDSRNNFDTTADDRGPQVKDFLVNTIRRPGLCLASNLTQGQCFAKPCGFLNDIFELQGISFGSGGNRSVLFGNTGNSVAANNITDWTAKSVKAAVPNIQEGLSSVFAAINNIPSNYLSFTIKDDPTMNPVISYIDPEEGPIGQYITIYGRNFKARGAQSKVEFYLPADSQNLIPADIIFPEKCRDDWWHDTYIVVKVPDVVARMAVPAPLLPGEKRDYKVIVTNTITSNSGLTSSRTSQPADFIVTTGTPGPGLCLLDPNNGPVTWPVISYGERFLNQVPSVSQVKYFNNKSVFNFPNSGWADRQIISNVPNGAATGPVRIINGETKLSNSLPFRVNKCSSDTECDASAREECCGGGSYWSGICRAKDEQGKSTCQLGSPIACGFSWSFTTTSCAANQTSCGSSACCSSGQTCDPQANNGAGQCNGSLFDSCSGYGAQCGSGRLCPNSPGKCSSKPAASNVDTGVRCGDKACLDFSQCRGQAVENLCAYSAALNKCKINEKIAPSSSSCDLTRVGGVSDNSRRPVTDSSGRPVDKKCGLIDNREVWYYESRQTCVIGWTKSIDGSKCLGQACRVCDSGLTCLAETAAQTESGIGVCAVERDICPANSSCSVRSPTLNKCVKTEAASCECCCDKNQNQAGTGNNPSCCSGLTCAGTCGSGGNFGKCAGCTARNTAGAVDQAASNAACNCAGTSGKFCDTSAAKGLGVCSDCSELVKASSCTKVGAGTCCVDAKNNNACRGGQAPYASGKPDYNYCAYYSCDAAGNQSNQCQGPQPAGDYRTANCDGRCGGPGIGQLCYAAAAAGSCDINNSQCQNGLVCEESSCTCKKPCNSNPYEAAAGYARPICRADNSLCAGTITPFCDTETCLCYSNPGIGQACYSGGAAGSCDINLSRCRPGLICDTEDTCTCVLPDNGGSGGELCQSRSLPACSSGAASCDQNAGYLCLSKDLDDNQAGDCRCCCDPNNKETSPDKICGLIDNKMVWYYEKTGEKCKDIWWTESHDGNKCLGPSCSVNSAVLKCTPDQTPCDTADRGLYCGCVRDDQCNAVGANLGCNYDGCCQTKPTVTSTVPAADAIKVCRNALVQATFNQLMQINTFNNNVIVAGDYGADQCPATTTYLTIAPKPAFLVKARLWLEKISPVNKLLTRGALADAVIRNRNYCAIKGAVSGYDTADGKKTVLEFKPQQVLDGRRTYYVIIKADGNAADAVKEGVLNTAGVSLKQIDSRNFNGVNFKGKIWSFTTLAEQAPNNGLCKIARAAVEPASYLFQTNINKTGDDNPDERTFDSLRDSDKKFTAKALAADGTELNKLTGVYDWTWGWNSAAPDIFNLFALKCSDNSGNCNNIIAGQACSDGSGTCSAPDDQRVVRVRSDRTKGRSVITATANVTVGLAPVGESYAATVPLYLMVCANPWPAVKADGSWEPWTELQCSDNSGSCNGRAADQACKDSAGRDIAGSRCILSCVPNSGNCANTNFGTYYCRDSGGPGTADDLPAILSDTAVARGSNLKCSDGVSSCAGKNNGDFCGSQGNKCQVDILKELYLFREGLPSTPSNFAVSALKCSDNSGSCLDRAANESCSDRSGTCQSKGGVVNASWSVATTDASVAGYKIYYGTASGRYNNSIEVAGRDTITKEISGLTNGRTYYFVLTSYNSKKAESAYSPEVIAVPKDTLAPPAPSILWVVPTASSTATIAWTANNDSTATGTVSYKVYYGGSPGVYGGTVSLARNKCIGAVACITTVDNLNPGATYYFTVSALDAAGNESAKSQEKGQPMILASRAGDLVRLAQAFYGYAGQNGGAFPDYGPDRPSCLGVPTEQKCWGGFNSVDPPHVGFEGNTALNQALAPYLAKIPLDPKAPRDIGDAYLYFRGIVGIHCFQAQSEAGTYIAWVPDRYIYYPDDRDDSLCGFIGRTACCGIGCSPNWFCVFKLK